MEWLNYHHLLYFWKVARLGSVARAAEDLRLAPPTISSQVKALEESLGEKLFERSGRSLVLTEVGRAVFEYADQIFNLGDELLNFVHRRPTGKPLRFHVGISDALAKVVVREILKPAFSIDQQIHVVCREGDVEQLIAELTAFRLDIVLSDRPAPEPARVRTYDHPLGHSGMTFLGAPAIAGTLGPGFPGSLDGAPALLPASNTAMRRSLDQWFDEQGVAPRVVAEFEDTALLMAFAGDDFGFLVVPTLAADVVSERFGSVAFGEAPECRVHFHAISAERRLKHPAVVAITEAAKERLGG